MKQLISFIISTTILLFAYLSTYWGLNRYLVFNNHSSLPLATILLLILISIPLSLVLIYNFDNKFTRYYYAFSMFWIGLICNFNIFLIIVVGLEGWAILFNLDLSPILGQILLTAGSIILSIYGLINAFNFRVRDYEVRVKDLPRIWHNKKVVQISDLHLGPIYRHKFLKRIINKINTLEVSAIFITGDLFDGMETDFSWIKEPFVNLKSEYGTFYSFGNHDLLLGFNHVKELLKDTSIVILDDKLIIKDGLQIIGLNYSFNSQFNLQEAILKQVDYTEVLPSVLLFHEPKHIDLAIKAGIDIQFSGHTHGGQLFPINLLTTLYYRGYNKGLYQKNGFSLLINNGIGTWGPAMRTLGRGEITRVKLLTMED